MNDESRGSRQQRPTLKTIARLSGLAVPTVSRALNDAPDIGADTKAKVRKIASEIGYRPNRAGVRLRTGKTNVIALVIATEPDVMNHTARLLTSIARRLRGTPYHMVMMPYLAADDPMAPIRYIVETGSADGIILNQTQPRDPRIAYLMEKKFPFVTHGRTEWDHPYADFDNSAFGRIAVDLLAQRGRKRIALIRPPYQQSYSIHLLEGAKGRAGELGLELVVPSDLSSDSPSLEIEQGMQSHLVGPSRCDGIISPSANAAMSIVAAAEQSGLRLGVDYDIAAKEALYFLRRFRREILTVHEDVGKVGSFLAEAMIERIANPDAKPLQFLEVPSNL